jgi:TolA-binding protein
VDCEKFDRVVLDLLYEELDELTSAAAKRHMDHCSRCRSIGAGLRATREVGVLPLLEPPAGLQSRILEAERKVRARLPLRQRIGRAVSVAADYAMRPQLAMAAVLLLMIGSSLLFLRVQPGQRDSIHVTERGVPESEAEGVAIVPLPEKRSGPAGDSFEAAEAPAGEPEQSARRDRKAESAPAEEAKNDLDDNLANAAPVAGAELAELDGGDVEYESAMQAYRDRRYTEAQKGFDQVASRSGSNAASAAFFAAQATRHETGCKQAAKRFDDINSRYRGSSIGNEAAWQAADCYRSLGAEADARRNYQQLLEVAAYKDRAQQALAALDQERVAARSAAPAPAAADKAPGKAKASKPAAKAAPPPKTTADQQQSF